MADYWLVLRTYVLWWYFIREEKIENGNPRDDPAQQKNVDS